MPPPEEPAPLEYANPIDTAPAGIAPYAIASFVTTALGLCTGSEAFSMDATRKDMWIAFSVAALATIFAIGALHDRRHDRVWSMIAFCVALVIFLTLGCWFVAGRWDFADA